MALAIAALLPLGCAGADTEPQDLRISEMPHLNIEKAQDAAFESETQVFNLAPKGENGSRLEYKVFVAAGDVVVYSIKADPNVVSEFHGQAEESKAVFFYREQDDVGTTHGQFISPMSGDHCWYFANQADTTATVTLELVGYYGPGAGLIEIPD